MRSVSTAALTLFYFDVRFLGLSQDNNHHPTFSSTPFTNGIPKGGTFRVHRGKCLILRTFQCNNWDFIHSSLWTLHCPTLVQWSPQKCRRSRGNELHSTSHSHSAGGMACARPQHLLLALVWGFQTPGSWFTHHTPKLRTRVERPSPPTFPHFQLFPRSSKRVITPRRPLPEGDNTKSPPNSG